VWGRNQQKEIPWVCDAHYGMISSIEFMVGTLNVPIYITNLSSDCAIYPTDILGPQYNTTPLPFNLEYGLLYIALCAHPSKKNPRPIIKHRTQ